MKFALAFVILILSSFSAPRCGATVYHSDGSAANVQLIHDTQAVNGDTITLPAGIFSWFTRVTITKGITIQGLTTTNSDNGTANDQTVLVDNLTYNGGIMHSFSAQRSGDKTSVLLELLSLVGGGGDTMYNGAIRLGAD